MVTNVNLSIVPPKDPTASPQGLFLSTGAVLHIHLLTHCNDGDMLKEHHPLQEKQQLPSISHPEQDTSLNLDDEV